MEKTIKKLNQSLEEYAAIQEKQIKSFDEELMPDLESHRFERAASFAKLKIHLDQFANIIKDQKNIELIVYYRDRLNQLIMLDEKLGQKIHQYKTELKQHLGDTRKKKTAFRGYANSIKSTAPKTICFSG